MSHQKTYWRFLNSFIIGVILWYHMYIFENGREPRVIRILPYCEMRIITYLVKGEVYGKNIFHTVIIILITSYLQFVKIVFANYLQKNEC